MSNGKVILWVVTAFFLVSLGEFYPKVAIGITSILVIDVLLINSDKYISLINEVQK